MNNTDLGTLAIIVGLALVTVLTRSFFFISSKSWQLPHWAQRGLQYAPIAALSAVVVPKLSPCKAYSSPLGKMPACLPPWPVPGVIFGGAMCW